MAVSKITSIVSSSDMTGQYTLDIGSTTTQFDAFVVDNEYKLLLDMLGAALYNTYQSDESDVNWVALRDGATGYTDFAGYIRNWQGLKNMLVPYHYSKWILSNEFQQSVTSMIMTDHENGGEISYNRRKDISDKAFNDFLIEYENAYDFMFSKTSDDSTKYNEFELWFKEKVCKGVIVNRTVR